MSTKLFVGGLSDHTDDEALRAAFESFGQLTEARVIRDRDTGRSRRFGFVRYTTPEEALAALEQMRGADIDGRTIRVDLAEERGGPPGRGPRPPRGPGPDRGGPPRGPRRDGPPPTVERRGFRGPRPDDRPGGPPYGDRRGPPPGGFRRGPPQGGGDFGGGPSLPPPPGEDEAGWEEARTPRRTGPRKKKERPEPSFEAKAKSASKPRRRESGRSWRDLADLDGDDGDDF